MTLDILLLLIILAIAVVLFSFEWIAADIVSLGILLALILLGLIPTQQAFSGFGSDAFIMILGLLILTSALVRTGVVESLGRMILERTGDNPNSLVAVIMGAAAALSAFMSNTASTAFFLPITIDLAHKTRMHVSRLLMPLAFATILASSVTLVSSSTNIVVSGIMTQHDLSPLGMFELSPVGIPIAVVGFFYMYWIGQRMIPERTGSVAIDEEFGIRQYLTEVSILPGSRLVGKTLAETGLGRDLDLMVLRVIHDRRRHLAPQARMVLEIGDILLIRGSPDQVLKIADSVGLTVHSDLQVSIPDLESDDIKLAEVILLQKSPLLGRTLQQLDFRERYGLQVLGLNRSGQAVMGKIGEIPLRLGDQLLVQGGREHLTMLDENNTFRLVGTVAYKRPNVRRGRLAVAIFGGALLISALNLLSLPVAVLLGVLIAFLTRCITPQEAYREVEWKALIVIGCMLALGQAMEHTGTAQYLAQGIVNLVGLTHPAWLLSGFFAITLLLTQPMSNQAAAVVVLPIALEAAFQLGLNPRTFAVMIAVAASCSFITPLEPACLLVYGPGGYRFADFVKVGSLLTILVYLVAILLVPLVWPL